MAVDELFANIAHYVYNPEMGYATVKVDVVKEPLSVEIGGIDIFIVKKSMKWGLQGPGTLVMDRQ